MIAEAVRVMAFGMLGIFLVMAIIYAVIVGLAGLSRRMGRHSGVVAASGPVAPDALSVGGLAIAPFEPVGAPSAGPGVALIPGAEAAAVPGGLAEFIFEEVYDDGDAGPVGGFAADIARVPGED